MNPVIRFRTSALDLAAEPENPINPIPGAVLLEWLRGQSELAELSEPSPEDWGWYSHVTHCSRGYMVGACIYPEPSGEHECLLQFEVHRTIWERITGRAKLAANDRIVAEVLQAVQRIAVPGSAVVEHGP